MKNLLFNLIIPKLRWLSVAYINPNIFGKFSRISSKEPKYFPGFLLISSFSAYFTAQMIYLLIHQILSSHRYPDLNMVTIIPVLGCLFTGIVMIIGDIVFLNGGFTMGTVLQSTHRLYTECGRFAYQKSRNPIKNGNSILDKISAPIVEKVASFAVLYSIMAPLFPSFVPFFNAKLDPTYFFMKAFSLSSMDYLKSYAILGIRSGIIFTLFYQYYTIALQIGLHLFAEMYMSLHILEAILPTVRGDGTQSVDHFKW
ncbi:hypothetical protein Fcan01_15386 [Folsomia candida]|uniref:Uncharacterized protein n=1 Tax=Folsomia candida TaxID=158441 RepID=A0A226DXB8_FOLCA|nr:hypothetical protein Fcan01_15386 [Folsomia candida]